MIGYYKIYFVLRNKSSRIRIVISCLKVVELCFDIVVVATVSYRVYLTNMLRLMVFSIIFFDNFIAVFIIDSMITPSIIYVTCNKRSVNVIISSLSYCVNIFIKNSAPVSKCGEKFYDGKIIQKVYYYY